MGLYTIGEFARAAGLTAKALRLYDESGLLPPAAVDPESGYRFYDPAQLAAAELIVELRRIGMPLAEIRTVCALDAPAAAEAVSAYWDRVAAQTADRAHTAALLVEKMSGRTAMIAFRSASACEAGKVRTTNEDAAYGSERLLAVADGVRGEGGAAASAAAIEALKPLESGVGSAVEVLTQLAEVDRAVRAVSEGAATTLTAVLRSGSRLALVHVGDTRAYLVRGEDLVQLTTDHTWVQSQIDQGKLDLAGAAAHPDRALLTRALGVGDHEADFAVRTAVAGDRYLLCSDGLSAVVDRARLHEAVRSAPTPEQAVTDLLELAHESGAPDNIACVVADVVTA
ncbi:MerR family transcriptional regulator [Cryptosporangium sp. NPDC048952]|uniref:MerR family transcriptional regulator n=1 Tax=Cryptosporangium sp. NPDC048952 TaxID=3363961 RepID=UPI00372012C4